MSPRRLARLSLEAGEALAQALSAFGVETRVKPPNDILARPITSLSRTRERECGRGEGRDRPWKKLAGILIEARSGGRRVDWLVVGVGINVNNRLPGGLDATSLKRLTGTTIPLTKALHTAVSAVLSLPVA